MREFKRIRSVLVSAVVFFLLGAGVGVEMSFPGKDGIVRSFFGWLKEWQELAVGFLAISAALIASYPVWRQLRANNLQAMIQTRELLFSRADGVSAALTQLSSFRRNILFCEEGRLQSLVGEFLEFLSALSHRYMHAPGLDNAILLTKSECAELAVLIAVDPKAASANRIEYLQKLMLAAESLEGELEALLTKLRQRIVIVDENVLSAHH